jgi:hypothetical protein
MTTIGVTGHQRLPSLTDWEWVRGQLQTVIAGVPAPVIGVSSLAIGADQLFAETVINVGGRIEAVIPFEGYEETFHGSAKDKFERFRSISSRVEVLERAGSDEECYLIAGRRVVDMCELLVAVWNGKPAAGLGGTADIVKYAFTQKRRLIHINPEDRTMVER